MWLTQSARSLTAPRITASAVYAQCVKTDITLKTFNVTNALTIVKHVLAPQSVGNAFLGDMDHTVSLFVRQVVEILLVVKTRDFVQKDVTMVIQWLVGNVKAVREIVLFVYLWTFALNVKSVSGVEYVNIAV